MKRPITTLPRLLHSLTPLVAMLLPLLGDGVRWFERKWAPYRSEQQW